ncbi:hypothetical protein HQN89_27685 [Paenibacillus frigoriresistens]|uniref:hypothetical protein n=1 Tax=Paenibacillus alginolyticus TaxID=59839 RepID=UPI0015638F25|nr:hypothetical protein [Paenibacillus frigoriresistens]NRF94684.1 hypothetical protein [Paenibacillus frigoriresistens]
MTDNFGDIHQLHVEIVPEGNEGHATAWNCEYIKIIQEYAGEVKSDIFPVNCWLGVFGRDPAMGWKGYFGAVVCDKNGHLVEKYNKVEVSVQPGTYILEKI